MKNIYKIVTKTETYIPLDDTDTEKIVWKEGTFWFYSEGSAEILDFSCIRPCDVPQLLYKMIELYKTTKE